MSIWEPMTLEESAQDIAERLIRRKYPKTRVDRALQRTVMPYATTNTYTVAGNSKLGDYYPYYTVLHDPAARSFHCTCHNTKYGESRSKGQFLCTHAIAVDYYLNAERILNELIAEKDREEGRQQKESITPMPNNQLGNSIASGLPYPSLDLSTSDSSVDDDEMPAFELPRPIPVFMTPEIPSLSDPMWQRNDNPPLPPQFQSLRPHQWTAIRQAIEAIQDPTVKVVFIDAPTGSGKTLIGECIRRLYSPKTLYLCTTKTLQDQVVRDFPYAKLLKGRSNYPTQRYPERFRPGEKDPFGDSITCADCSKTKIYLTHEEAGCITPHCTEKHWEWVCPLCDNPLLCAYEVAKAEALSPFSPLAVLNTAYYLTEMNGPRQFQVASLIILDEADTLERILLSHVEIRISATVRRKLSLTLPERKTVPQAWDDWVQEKALPAIKGELDAVKKRINLLGGKSDVRSIKERRWQRQLAGLNERLSHCKLANGDWVYCYTKTSNPDAMPVVFKPIKVDWCARDLLWKNCNKWVLMSATFIDPYGMAEDLGLSPDEIRVVSVANTFPKERRPIYVLPRADMSYKRKQQEMPLMVAAVREVLDAYPDERILVHSVSYELTNALMRGLQSKRVMTYTMAGQRDQTLNRFKNTPAAVLIAPSLDRGVDLPDDDCRVVVIAKVPFPDLSDKQTNARLYSKGGQRWYAATTVRTIAQMTGRAMRSKDDYCDIYILDTQFLTNLWKKSKFLFPGWWREAVVMSGSPKVAFKKAVANKTTAQQAR